MKRDQPLSSYRYNVALAFREVVNRHADRPALTFPGGKTIAYRDLDRLVNKFAAVFARRGLAPRDVLGIVHTKSLECYAAMLAALKLGAAYLNLDERNPAPRLEHIFSTARPKLVFATSASSVVRETAAKASCELLELGDAGFAADLASAGGDEPAQIALAIGNDPAYVIYTSGSTGKPKGAILTHDNLLRFCEWSIDRFAIEPTDVLTGLNPMYFDGSVFDFYAAVLSGASMVPIARDTNPAALLNAVDRAQCTTWFSVPSMLLQLETLKLLTPDRLPAIRQILTIGEVYPKPELRKLYATYGSRSTIVNTYGPTECTVFCSAWDVREEDFADLKGSVPLGPIAPNCSALILTEGRRAAPGEIGELYVMGAQVGLGYINDPERTDKAFVTNPLNERWRERAYKTGDLVRFAADDQTIEYVGRADYQIKHMGYRIELEEIEAAINEIEGVVQSAVLHKADRSGMKVITAYVAGAQTLSKPALRERLALVLPSYMIPQRIDLRPALPQNANGKIDRVALAAE
ncbi:MAG: amino acid adenylation domain-containing protein [Candidatus Eremiobacteraeota bacterium]|nr:amino acid adenylation domain-containing protein [Candidatus Eremiobacteraeota bacterium]